MQYCLMPGLLDPRGLHTGWSPIAQSLERVGPGPGTASRALGSGYSSECHDLGQCFLVAASHPVPGPLLRLSGHSRLQEGWGQWTETQVQGGLEWFRHPTGPSDSLQPPCSSFQVCKDPDSGAEGTVRVATFWELN